MPQLFGFLIGGFICSVCLRRLTENVTVRLIYQLFKYVPSIFFHILTLSQVTKGTASDWLMGFYPSLVTDACHTSLIPTPVFL